MEITLKLSLDKVNGLLTILGKLPTETNVWPLANEIREQAQGQLPQQEQEDVGQAGGTD